MRLQESTAIALHRVAVTRDRLQAAREVLRRQVRDAREAGASWESIGRMLCTSGEAARKTYGPRRPAVRADDGGMLW